MTQSALAEGRERTDGSGRRRGADHAHGIRCARVPAARAVRGDHRRPDPPAGVRRRRGGPPRAAAHAGARRQAGHPRGGPPGPRQPQDPGRSRGDGRPARAPGPDPPRPQPSRDRRVHVDARPRRGPPDPGRAHPRARRAEPARRAAAPRLHEPGRSAGIRLGDGRPLHGLHDAPDARPRDGRGQVHGADRSHGSRLPDDHRGMRARDQRAGRGRAFSRSSSPCRWSARTERTRSCGPRGP